MPEEGMDDWDAALVELLAEEEAYLNAANMYKEWSDSSYGEFKKIDAFGTVAIAVVGYLAGYPNVKAFVDDMDSNAIAWVMELIDSAILQGILIGLGVSAPTDNTDAIYMSPDIVQFLTGEGYESHFDPPKDYNPNAEEED
jgi:hypothetical protein